jgi:large subunit ribosomal protein L9
MPASPGNLKVFERERKKLQLRMDSLRSEAAALAAGLEGLTLTIAMRVGENDKLYGSVTSAIIGDALAGRGLEVDRRRILLDAPIRTLGEHEVRVRLHADVVPSFVVKVVSDDRSRAGEEKTPAPAEDEASAVPEAEHALES